MKKTINYIKAIILGGLLSVLLFTSCLDDLNQKDPYNTDEENIVNEQGAQSFLAKIYLGLSLPNNKGGADGEEDIKGPGLDQGTLVFLRGMLTMQQFPTDETIWNWKNDGIVELVNVNWDYTTIYAYTFYQRAMLNLRYCKEYLDVFTPESNIPNVELYRNEVRALRALNYYYLIDMYGNPGIIWDDSPINDPTWYPSQIGRKALFEKIVTELEDLETNSNLPDRASATTYGRMTKQVVRTLLAKMYLNAEVYTGQPMYDKAVKYCDDIISSKNFDLEEKYSNLFCGENHLTAITGKNEFIFAIPFDAENTKSNGGTIMLSTGASGGEMNGKWLGNNNAWTCLKTKESLIKKFDYAPDGGLDIFKSQTKKDGRYLFFDILTYNKDGITVPDNNWPFDPETGTILYEVKDRRKKQSELENWNTGYLCYKFSNLGWDNKRVELTDFPNTDFPLFRLADIYLMYAECATRGFGDKNKAVELVNELRRRAYYGQSSVEEIEQKDLTLDFILDERSRELYWEGHRRSDLIRFGKFTQGYAWPYKGGIEEGIPNISSKYNLYPISDRDLTSNPNLVQNPGYKSVR